jgi:thiol:disulfide interchange protein DsbD
VRAAFAASRLGYLKGDWTHGEPAIGALLREHGREGVPMYLLYPPGGGAPALLPQVLTEGIVLRALARDQLVPTRSSLALPGASTGSGTVPGGG